MNLKSASHPVSVAAATALLALTACGPSEPTEAEQVKALPVMSMDRSLAFFRQVCVDNGPDTSGGAVLFDRTPAPDGTSLCTMRARTAPGTDEFQELRRRYGTARGAGRFGILTEYPGYPGGPLIFMAGIKGGVGEDTYQVAIRK